MLGLAGRGWQLAELAGVGDGLEGGAVGGAPWLGCLSGGAAAGEFLLDGLGDGGFTAAGIGEDNDEAIALLAKC